MSAVELTIVQPLDGTVFFQGEPHVQLVGQVKPPPAEPLGVALYYRWYSNLFPSQKDRYSINANALSDPSVPYDASLGVGTHVISLAASDRAGEEESEQNATAHGGIAGAADGDKRCVIHVLKAILVTPGTANSPLKRAGDVLEAEAPIQWGREKSDEAGVYEPNPTYHDLNKIRYLWHFEPDPPDRRKSATLVPSVQMLTFVPPGTRPLVRYDGELPAGLGVGAYTLTLCVEELVKDSNVVPKRHETSLAVVLT
jgi:hypothetical protein